MSYNKPEIVVLGEAVRVIQSNKQISGVDPDGTSTLPAYELDE